MYDDKRRKGESLTCEVEGGWARVFLQIKQSGTT